MQIEPLFLVADVPFAQYVVTVGGGVLLGFGMWRALRGDIARKDAENRKAWEAVHANTTASTGLIGSVDKLVELHAANAAERRAVDAQMLAANRGTNTQLARIAEMLAESRNNRATG